MNRNTLNWLIAIVAITIILKGSIIVYKEIRERNYRRIERAFEQLRGLNRVSQYIEFAILDDPNILTNIVANKTYNNTQIIEMVTNSQRGDIWLIDMHQGKDLIDIWGHPLRIQFSAIDIKKQKVIVTIWSIGRNGIDEQGKSDDIITARDIHRLN